MGNAKFRFYPEPNGNQLVTIDLGEPLAELYSDWEYTSSTGQTMNGKLRTSTMLNREVITIIRDRMQGGEELANKLLGALQNHLDRGYSVHFTADDNGNYAHPLKISPTGGDTTLELFGNPFYTMGLYQQPDAGDYCVIESSPPGAVYEIVKIQSRNNWTWQQGGTVTLAEPVKFTYPGSTWLRFYRSWPILKRIEADRGKNCVTNEHGIAWSLQLRLTPDYDNYFQFHPLRQDDFVPSDADSGLQAPGVITDPGQTFEGGIVTLDNPPRQNAHLEDMFETNINQSWNNWRNWGN